MKRIAFLFSVLFLLLCAVPLAAMLILGPAEPAANQVLAAAPDLTNQDGSLNGDYLSDLSRYVDQRFGFRQELITLQARMTAAVFRESATDSVILGREGWLFYSDTLADYQGTAPLSDRAVWAAAHVLALMQECAGEAGARFLFVMAPNKNTLYPQYMPPRCAASETRSNWARLKEQLDAQGVAYADLIPVLSAERDPVYYRTDSHWTPYGSALAHDAILNALGAEAALADEAFTVGAHVGDLQEMLYPADPAAENGPVLARERQFTHLGGFRSPEDMTIRTESGGALGSLLMFRDSFGNTLYADMAESFSRACFSRSMPVRMDLLEQTAADTVVMELVERNLSWLATRAPVMAAPRRELPEGAGQGQSVKIQMQESSPLEGLACYTGLLPELDADSPVLVALDGVCYEATPAGLEDGSYTLYAPPARSAAVYARIHGKWVSCSADLCSQLPGQ